MPNEPVEIGVEYKDKVVIPDVPKVKKGNRIKYSKGWCYQYEDKSWAYGFADIDGETYYFDKGGYMVTGWQKINGKDYAFKSSGAMYKNEWCGNYYLGSDGKMLKDQKIAGTNYYVDANGKYVPQGWQSNSKGWWYVDGPGFVKSDFRTISGHTYYFGADGYMVTGWKKINNAWYYFNGSGYMLKGWLKDKNKWYFFDDDKDPDKAGKMVTGWKKADGKMYFFNPDGSMEGDESVVSDRGYSHLIGNTYNHRGYQTCIRFDSKTNLTMIYGGLTPNESFKYTMVPGYKAGKYNELLTLTFDGDSYEYIYYNNNTVKLTGSGTYSGNFDLFIPQK